MGARVIRLKTETAEFQAMSNKSKTFEVRRNDREFREGDVIVLEEVVQGIPTGRTFFVGAIRYILDGGKWGLAKGYCVFNC